MANTYSFLDKDESVLMEGSANKKQFLGITKGGKLILTSKKIVFIAHALNFGSKYDEIPLSSVAISGDKLNILVPTPNLIKVITKDGKQHQFVVVGKQKSEWKQKISETVEKYR